jgi:type IV pilus assembly protein PilW
MKSIKTRHFMSTTSAQRGRSLIELMVAIALGLLILLGVGGLYVASNQSTRAATGVASSENVGNVALSLIGASIRRAGYGEIAGAYTSLPTGGEARLASLLYQGRSLAGCSEARFASDDPNNACQTATTGNPDAIGIWYQADNALASSQAATTDCVGVTPADVATPPQFQAAVATMRIVQNSFYVANDQLRCRGSTGTDQPLLDGVEEMKVFYGFDDAAFADPASDMNPVARSLRTAAEINGFADPTPATASALSAWDYVVSVTVCVRVRTEEAGVAAQGGSVTFNRCPQDVDQALGIDAIATGTATDGRVRRTHIQTFAVRGRARPTPL